MRRSVALKAGLIQLACVAVLGAGLGLALGHHFFEDNGWFAGPVAWIVCASIVALALHLPWGSVLVGAVLAGIPSAVATALGLHWEGALLAIVLFALWCGRLAVDRDLIEEIV